MRELTLRSAKGELTSELREETWRADTEQSMRGLTLRRDAKRVLAQSRAIKKELTPSRDVKRKLRRDEIMMRLINGVRKELSTGVKSEILRRDATDTTLCKCSPSRSLRIVRN